MRKLRPIHLNRMRSALSKVTCEHVAWGLVQKPTSLTPGSVAGNPIHLMTPQRVSGVWLSAGRSLYSLTLGVLTSARALEEIGLSLPEREACFLRGGGGGLVGALSRARCLDQGSRGLPRQLNIVIWLF